MWDGKAISGCLSLTKRFHSLGTLTRGEMVNVDGMRSGGISVCRSSAVGLS